MTPHMGVGHYDIYVAVRRKVLTRSGPTLSFARDSAARFRKGRLINSFDHPVLKRLAVSDRARRVPAGVVYRLRVHHRPGDRPVVICMVAKCALTGDQPAAVAR